MFQYSFWKDVCMCKLPCLILVSSITQIYGINQHFLIGYKSHSTRWNVYLASLSLQETLVGQERTNHYYAAKITWFLMTYHSRSMYLSTLIRVQRDSYTRVVKVVTGADTKTGRV